MPTMTLVSYRRIGPVEKGQWQFSLLCQGFPKVVILGERNGWPCIEECSKEQVEGWLMKNYKWAFAYLLEGAVLV